ncbi:MAG: DUF4364 family protein [Eubacteriales bacterium]|nr:DUF4364 family protein [Eubacteriales bacterium]
MQSSLPKRKISDAENRLRLLFCVDALAMVTREQLWPFVAGLELMEYMPMCLYVDELCKDGSLLLGTNALKDVLCLTEKGRSTLRLFLSRLPVSDRERIRKAAPAYAASLQERRIIRAVHELAPGGGSRTACTVTEGDFPTLFLRVDGRGLAGAAIKRFRSCAPQILTLLYTLPLMDEKTEPILAADLSAALEQATPNQPAICAYGKHEFSGVVQLRKGNSSMWIALLTPTESEARQWSNAALHQSSELFERIEALLLGKDGV